MKFFPSPLVPRRQLDKLARRSIIAILAMLLLVSCSAPGSQVSSLSSSVVRVSALIPVAATAKCVTSSPSSGAYSVTVCLTSPSSGATVNDNIRVNASVTLTGSAPYVQRVMFYQNGAYLLTDFQSAYSFVLPTWKWVDGSYTISVAAAMHDGFVTNRASVAVVFKNGITSTPVNTNQFQPTSGRSASSGSAFIVAAGGDGASGQSSAANVSNMIVSLNPNLFLYLGDVYAQGAVAEFYNWYGTSSTFFDRLRSITDPTVGNHEYLTPKAAGYYDYWDNIAKYYSFNAHDWHLISLNSNGYYVPTAAGSAEYDWLQHDLASLPAGTCTIAYYHHPLFNIGPEGAAAGMQAIWQLMASYHVDIVLNGHDHDYQRWIPLDGSGTPNAGGITEFVAGGAGHGIQTFIKSDSRVAYSNDTVPTAFGVLLLQLNPKGANFNYRNSSGSVLDAGVIPCKPVVSDTTPPTTPGGFTASALSSNRVKLTWKPSSDNVGVVAYRILRNGVNIATVRTILATSTYTFTDSTVSASTAYKYSMYAYDPSGNHSATAGPVSVTTPTAVLLEIAAGRP